MEQGKGIVFTPVQHSPFSRRMKIRQLAWHVVNMTLFRYSPFFCRRFRVLLLRFFGAKIDWTCSIDCRVEIEFPWQLVMGRQSRLSDGSYLQCLAPVALGENVLVGRDVNIMTGSHRLSSPAFELITAPVIIHDNAWVATRAFVHKGITIGEGAVVGACSVVAKDVAPWTVVAGNPATYVRDRKLKEES